MARWVFTDANGNVKTGEDRYTNRSKGTSVDSSSFKSKSNYFRGQGDLSRGQLFNILGMATAARAAHVGKNGWNPKNFTRFQQIINADPKIGWRMDIDYDLFVRTKMLTPWKVELFLKQMERNAITLGIHKTEDQRKAPTYSWNFKRWYGQLPYWAGDYIRGNYSKTISEDIDAELDQIFGPMPGSSRHVPGRRNIPGDAEYFNPYGNDEDYEYTRSEWRANIPRDAKFIPASDGVSYWALYNPRIFTEGRSNAHLGAILEYGNIRDNQPPKPWLRTAVDENIDTIRGIWTDCIRNTFRSALEVGQFGPWVQVGGKKPRFVKSGIEGGDPVFMGWDQRGFEAPGLGMGDKFYKNKADKQNAQFENMFREMLQAHRPLLAYLEVIAKDSLKKIERPSEFTQDYKNAGGMKPNGGKFVDLAPSDSSPGVFTGQLYNAIKARWESSPRILQR